MSRSLDIRMKRLHAYVERGDIRICTYILPGLEILFQRECFEYKLFTV